MPQYRMTRRGADDRIPILFREGLVEADDVVVSPDRKTVKYIKAYTHEVVEEPLENFRQIEHYQNDDHAREFTYEYSEYGKEREVPVLWKKWKGIKE